MNKTAIIAVASLGVLIFVGTGVVQAAGPQFGFGMGRMHRSYEGKAFMNNNFKSHHEKLAEFLGLSEVDLSSAIHSGKSIEEIAALHGKTSNDLKIFFEKQHQEHIQNLKIHLSEEVKSGKITQEQMDKRLIQIENLKGVQGMHGTRGFFRHMGSPLTSK